MACESVYIYCRAVGTCLLVGGKTQNGETKDRNFKSKLLFWSSLSEISTKVGGSYPSPLYPPIPTALFTHMYAYIYALSNFLQSLFCTVSRLTARNHKKRDKKIWNWQDVILKIFQRDLRPNSVSVRFTNIHIYDDNLQNRYENTLARQYCEQYMYIFVQF